MKTLLFFLQFATRFQKQLWLSLFLSVLLAGASIALFSLSGWFISACAIAGSFLSSAIIFNYFLPASIIRLLALLRISSRYFARVIDHDYTFKILSELRVWFYKKLIPLPPGSLLQLHSGKLLNQMISDITILDQLYINLINPLFQATLIIFIIPTVVFFYDRTMGEIIFILFLLLFLTLTFFSLHVGKKCGEQLEKNYSLLRKNMTALLQRSMDVLIFYDQKSQSHLIDDESHRIQSAENHYALFKSIITVFFQIFSGMTVLVILWLGNHAIQSHTLSAAGLVMIVFLMIAGYEQLSFFPLSCLQLTKSMASANRIYNTVSEEKISIDIKQVSDIVSEKKLLLTSITIDRITFHYPNTTSNIFHNFSQHITPGEKVVLNSPSGFGKTTLLQLIACVYHPTSGAIYLNNTHLKNIPEKTLRATIGYLTQHIHIFNATVRDNLTLFDPTISDNACKDMLSRMQLSISLDAMAGELGKNFSGGECRRIALARTLLHNTPILLLDEPSTGLEDGLFTTIWNNCADILNNKTVVIASHDSEIESIRRRQQSQASQLM